MRKNTRAFHSSANHGCGKSSRKSVPLNVFGGGALALIVLGCLWTVYSNVFGASIYPSVSASGIETDVAPSLHASVKRKSTVALLTAAYTPEPDTATFSERFPLAPRDPDAPVLQVERQVAARTEQVKPQSEAPAQPSTPAIRQVASLAVPVPAPRPAEARPVVSKGPSAREVAEATKATAVASTGSIKPASIFDKLFGKREPSGPVYAYAAPDGGVMSDGREAPDSSSPRYDRLTAVYDISAHTVYMPDGTKLEAHSGLGSMLDDPRYVRERMRGATPPHLYDLKLRESLFHGVAAIRLNPVGGEGAIFGRSGLLAHTYMLGPHGDSNGCVSFRNYDAFLQAFREQKVRRLAVVAKLD
jgi:hypothetical protein